jgi:hypothetical protein
MTPLQVAAALLPVSSPVLSDDASSGPLPMLQEITEHRNLSIVFSEGLLLTNGKAAMSVA